MNINRLKILEEVENLDGTVGGLIYKIDKADNSVLFIDEDRLRYKIKADGIKYGNLIKYEDRLELMDNMIDLKLVTTKQVLNSYCYGKG